MAQPIYATPAPAEQYPLQHEQSDSSGPVGAAEAEKFQHTVCNTETIEKQLPSFYSLRLLAITCIPALITAYYSTILRYFLQRQDDTIAKYSNHSGSLVFYAWFVISIFGLSWAKFGLVGLESRMINSRCWGLQGRDTLQLRRSGTWSSPSSWVRGLWLWMRSPTFRDIKVHRLRILLAVLSILPFVAIPLSGLVFELSDGYIASREAPQVRGWNVTTFNERYESFGEASPALMAWKAGSVPVLPGIGIMYVAASADRSAFPSLQEIPNSFPLTESAPELFLAPQADSPTSGQAWGLRVSYNCSIVQSASEFTILTEKSASSLDNFGCIWKSTLEDCVALRTPSGNMIRQGRSDPESVHNVEAYFEIGTSAVARPPRYQIFGDPPVGENENPASYIMEYALWQFRNNGSYDDSIEPFDATVGRTIEGLGSPLVRADNGGYVVDDTFFGSEGNDTEDLSRSWMTAIVNNTRRSPLDAAPPVGVRCIASSQLGTAEIDGMTSTFGNFQRLDPEHHPMYNYGPEPFSAQAEAILGGQFFPHYIAGGLSGLRPVSNSNRYSEFVSATALLRSVSLAYATDAFDLMYGMASGYKREWEEPRLTSSREGKILAAATLVPGPGMGRAVHGLLLSWALLSTGLGLYYTIGKGLILLVAGPGRRVNDDESLEGYREPSAYGGRAAGQ
jgi:hypothetical protein